MSEVSPGDGEPLVWPGPKAFSRTYFLIFEMWVVLLPLGLS